MSVLLAGLGHLRRAGPEARHVESVCGVGGDDQVDGLIQSGMVFQSGLGVHGGLALAEGAKGFFSGAIMREELRNCKVWEGVDVNSLGSMRHQPSRFKRF